MARTPLFRLVRRALLAHSHHRAHRGATDLDRRRLLLGGAGAALALPLVGGAGCGEAAPLTARVAIVGGGLAGLHAAYRLAQRGLEATVFEAGKRAGGRLFTDRATFAQPSGQHAELGGELIDTSHMTMRDLAMELGIELLDYDTDDATLARDAAYFDARLVPEDEVLAGFAPIAMAIDEALAQATDPEQVASYQDPNGLGDLDQLSITAWLDSVGASGPARALLEVAYTIEYGLEASEQSALNLLSLISSDTQALELFGESDERFHAAAGSDAFTSKLAAALKPSQLLLEHRLVRVAQEREGYRLHFDAAGGTREVLADHVVLALPFTMLRQVELRNIELPAAKYMAVQELGYGTNTKLMVGFSARPWRDLGQDGSSYTDLGYQATWDTSRLQPGKEGILTNFTGGAHGLAIADGAPDRHADKFLAQLDKVFPGSAGAATGAAARFGWPTYPLTLGSYACYKVGQWTRFGGSEFERVGNVHFAGEHTSVDAQGYMEGAALTGAMVAEAIGADLGLSTQGLSIPARRIGVRAKLALREGSWLRAMVRAGRARQLPRA